jgi:hypothetical protein
VCSDDFRKDPEDVVHYPEEIEQNDCANEIEHRREPERSDPCEGGAERRYPVVLEDSGDNERESRDQKDRNIDRPVVREIGEALPSAQTDIEVDRSVEEKEDAVKNDIIQ